MCHIDNGSISIADWIGFKRIIWGCLSSSSPPNVSSQSDSIRFRSRSSLAESSFRSTPQLVIRSLCKRVAKTVDVIVVLKKKITCLEFDVRRVFESGN